MTGISSAAASQSNLVDHQSMLEIFFQHLKQKYSRRTADNHQRNLNYFITYMVNTYLLNFDYTVLDLFSTAVSSYEDFLNKLVEIRSISIDRKKSLLSKVLFI